MLNSTTNGFKMSLKYIVYSSDGVIIGLYITIYIDDLEHISALPDNSFLEPMTARNHLQLNALIFEHWLSLQLN